MDNDIFPPEVEYKLNEEVWNEPKYRFRQIRVVVDGSTLLVLNCNKHDGKWKEPSMIVMRSTVPERELNLFQQIIANSRWLMTNLSLEEITFAEMEELIGELL